MNYIIKIILWILGFFIALSLLQFLLSIMPPKFRSANAPDDYGLPYEDISFQTQDGITLRGWYIHDTKKKPTIIIAHGYPFDKGNVLPVMRFLYPDYHLLFFDFRSFGESDGWVTTGGWKERQDITAAVTWVRKQSDQPIGVYGFSLGGAAVILSKDQHISAGIADSSYATYTGLFHQLFWILGPAKYIPSWCMQAYAYLVFGLSSRNASPLAHISAVPFPLFIIHGAKDSQIPIDHAHQLYAAAPQKTTTLWVIPGADHGQAFATHPTLYKKKVLDFFDTYLR